MMLASRIFVHYIRYYDAFGSMMKLSISKCKEVSHVLWSKTILQSLKQLFEEIRDMSSDGELLISINFLYGYFKVRLKDRET